ncbi:hypothetical protein [Saccharopolyspora shandongensis]|nr:hypothetical protein [Saccharopolyspora shandongensis]
MNGDVVGLLAGVVAGGALGVAIVSWWGARRSARAAEHSAAAAAQALSIGRKSAEAALRSADAAGRSAEPAEGARRGGYAPLWELTPAPSSGGGCQITARYVGGPAGMTVTVGYYGVLYGSATNGKAPGKAVAGTRIVRRPITRDEPFEIPIACPEGWGHVVAIELHLALQSVEGHAVTDDVPSKPWFDAEYVAWEREPATASE